MFYCFETHKKEVNKSNKTGTCLFNIHLGITLLQKIEETIYIYSKIYQKTIFPISRKLIKHDISILLVKGGYFPIYHVKKIIPKHLEEKI